jgi:flagella basal body P-ring formation protein FlgA
MNSGMFNTSVKTPTPAQALMQVLCLTVFWLWLLAMPLISLAQALSPAESMSSQVKQWLSKNNEINSKDVTILPLDSRLKVQACSKALSLDHPFASKETVRVRCTEPNWQLYIQVSMPSTAIAASSSNAATQNSGPSSRTMVVTKRLLQRGAILQPDMLEEVQASPGNADTQLLSTVKDAHQAELTRDVAAGQPLRISDIRRAVLVKQGQVVMLSVGNSKDFQITIRMEALQDGRLGEQVRLKNPESGKQVSGVVTGPSMAKGL